MPIHYPEDFKNRVLETYPDIPPAFKSALINGEEILGRFLNDNVSYRGISAQIILDSINNGRIDKLKSIAERIVAKQKLYEEWYGIVTATKKGV